MEKHTIRITTKLKWWVIPLVKLVAFFKAGFISKRLTKLKIGKYFVNGKDQQPLYFKDFI